MGSDAHALFLSLTGFVRKKKAGPPVWGEEGSADQLFSLDDNLLT